MNVPYVLRLLCLCLASFFIVNALLGLGAALASRAAVRMAETMRARTAAHFLFAVRLLPSAVGISAVVGLCVPSYLWLEPQATAERVGWTCLTLGLFGALGLLLSFARTARSVAASARCNRLWRKAGSETQPAGEPSQTVIVDKEGPLLAIAGVFRPQLVVSNGVLRALSADELDVALQHENAHRLSRDNLKRLFLLLAPGPIPFLASFSSLDRAWAKFSEWAADDEAAAGDPLRALSLAAALLHVARMGAGPRLNFLYTSLVARDDDLSARVDRLLRIQPAGPLPPPWARGRALGVGLGIAACVSILLASAPILASVHRLLELFVH
jgi:Zn-dependent protease with chaperone function